MRGIGTLGGPASFVRARNDLGQVSGGADVGPAGAIVHAYHWRQATDMLDLSRPDQGACEGHDAASLELAPACEPCS